MNQDHENQNSSAIGKVIRVLLIIGFSGLAYYVNVRLFFMLLGLYVVVFILSHIGVATVDRRDSENENIENPENLSVRVYTPHHPLGPRTDTRNMNRSELFHSGLQFLAFGILPFFTIVGIAIINASFEVIPEPVAMVIVFASVIFLLMCLFGGAYLMLRGLLRRPEKTPETQRESAKITQ